MSKTRVQRRAFLKGTAAALATGFPARSQGRPPNIVLMFADNLGYGDLGCYGSIIRTPNLDKLAAEGIRFTHAYSASPICSPARAALLTGRYPPRAGMPGLVFSDSVFGLPDSEITLAQILKKSGYKTACIGKWHLGHTPRSLPVKRGFDEYFGLPYSADMTPLPLMRGTEVIEEPANLAMLTSRYTGEALKFIDQARNGPFFLYIPHTAPHPPQAASPKFRGKSPAGIYGDMVEEMDWSVGQVLDRLEMHRLTENTIVLFASDNGPMNLGSSGLLRGSIGSSFEGGVRIPFIASMPGRIPKGRVSQAVVSMMDVMPTIAHLCRIALPAGQLDGIDIWPLLSGERGELQRDVLLYFDNVNIQCARLGRYKLHLARYNLPGSHPRPGRYNLLLDPMELYDVVSDPGEAYDVAPEHPDVIADILKRVEKLVQSMPLAVQEAYRETKARKTAPRRWPGLSHDPLEPQRGIVTPRKTGRE